MSNLILIGKVLDCSLAKPQADQKSSGPSISQKGVTLPTYPPHVGYGMIGAPYGAVGAGIAQVEILFNFYDMVGTTIDPLKCTINCD